MEFHILLFKHHPKVLEYFTCLGIRVSVFEEDHDLVFEAMKKSPIWSGTGVSAWPWPLTYKIFAWKLEQYECDSILQSFHSKVRQDSYA